MPFFYLIISTLLQWFWGWGLLYFHPTSSRPLAKEMPTLLSLFPKDPLLQAQLLQVYLHLCSSPWMHS